MITLEPPKHPSVLYWACPRGDCRISAPGAWFTVLAAMGLVVETEDLATTLPPTQLEALEAAVEEHEAGCSS